jgi:hypothetical protein
LCDEEKPRLIMGIPFLYIETFKMAGPDRDRILRIADLLPLAVAKMATERPGNKFYSHDESPIHLRWMIGNVQSTHDIPDDKSGRWLGCVYGLAAAQDAVPSQVEKEIWRILSHSRVEMPFSLGEAYAKIVPELSVRLKRLRDRADVPASILNLMQFDIDWIAGEHKGEGRPSVLWASFQIGYIQGYLKAFNEIDFTEERDRTRPIMHAAYNAVGIAPPATVERLP